jgi:CotH protein/lamin tail-like protein/chitobiase/beta-hexosaminidase-like protein
MFRPARHYFSALFLALLLAASVPASAALLINELMASNSGAAQDPQGDYDDWIELYNSAGEPVDAGGMSLTDDVDVPTKWQIPADDPSVTTIPANGYLVIWADNDTADAGLHASFKLNAGGDQLALFDEDGTQLDHVAFAEQNVDMSYGRDPNAPDQWRYFGAPTPGSANTAGYAGLVADTKFSHDRGFYDAPFYVTLTTATEGASIYYTVDGSEPFDEDRGAPGGHSYSEPIFINTTTCLRAVAFKLGWKPTNIDTQTYLFLDDVIRQPANPSGWPTNWGHTGSGDFEMDPEVVEDPLYRDTIEDDLKAVPTLSLVTHTNNWFGSGGQGIYPQGELSERPVSAELIFADDREGFQLNCAVMIVGGSSTGRWKMDKLSMRLKFQAAYGPTKLRYPVFGDDATDEFDTLVVDARMNNSWAYGGGVGVSRSGAGQRDLAQYTRDQFVADLQNAMGGYGPRGRHVHLYLNGLYWGLYWLHERPDEHFAAAYFGGDSEDYDVLKHQSGRVVSGSSADYRDMLNLASAGEYGQIQQHLDVPDFIDYLLANYYVGNTDWAHQNWYASRGRVDPEGRWRYHSWDAEHSMEGLNDNSTGRNNSGGPTGVHYGLLGNDEYRMRFADHVHRRFFNGGVLTPEGATALYQIRLDEVDRAVVGESARWGDNHRSTPYTRDIEWIEEKDYLLDTYLSRRTEIVFSQLQSRGWYPNVSAPVFQVEGTYQHGGQIDAGSAASMTASASDIWYTLDGSDPRIPGTSAAPGDDTALVSEGAPKKVLVPTNSVDDTWRGDPAFDDTAWISGTGGVGYERSTGYEQFFDIDLADQMYGRNAGCYIRIPFDLAPEDLEDAGGLTLKMRYDDGFIAYLNGVEIQRVMFDGAPSWNSRATTSHSDLDAIDLETFYVSDSIDQLRLGENILAIHGLNAGATSSDFLISVELAVSAGTIGGAPGGTSPSAVQYTGPITLSVSTPVKARALNGATWSALNEAVFAVGPVAETLRISEIMYHPADPNTEYIELTNVGTETLNLNLVQFTNGVDFTFPSLELAPGDYVLVVEDTAAFEAWYGGGSPIAGQYTGSLRNAGERLELQDAAGQIVRSFRFQDNWYEITDGQGFSLTVKDPAASDATAWDDKAAWRPSANTGGSPGYDDTGDVPELGAIVINELMTNPETGATDWIELHNTTDRPIDISGWFLSDDADDLTKYEIAAGTTIAPGGYEVLLQDEHFGNDSDPGCHDPFALSRSGETLRLHSGSNGTLTGYSDQEQFDASEMGISLGRHRKSTGTVNFVALSQPTPGEANAEPQVSPIVINEVMYHPAELADAEYVELLNISDEPVTLYDEIQGFPWRFTDDPDNPEIELLLPTAEPVTLASGQCVVLTKNVVAFEMAYTTPTDLRILEWGGGRLADGGSKIQLSKPGEQDGDDGRHWIRTDRIVYGDGSWPLEANGQGLSLHRIDPARYGNDPANWQAASPSPGRPN